MNIAGTSALAYEIFAAINRHTLPGDGITRPSYSEQETGAMITVSDYAKSFGFETSCSEAKRAHGLVSATSDRSERSAN